MRGRVFVLLVSVALALVGIAGASASYQPPPGDLGAVWLANGRQLAYRSLREPAGLRILNLPDQKERISPVTGVAQDEELVSPDGQWIAGLAYLGAGVDAPTELVAQRFDGAGRQVLTTLEPLGGFAWSPDSSRVAFAAAQALYVVRADGTGLTKVASAAGPVAAGDPYAAPAWSLDASMLSFSESDANGRELAVVGADGGPVRVVAPAMQDAAWSPDGLSIAGVRFVNNQSQIDVVDVATGAVRSFPVSYPLSFQRPDVLSWSANSSALIYSQHLTNPSEEYGAAPVYRIDVASGTQTQVVSAGYDARYSPDGSQIAFATFGSCTAGNYVMPSAGGTARRITNDCSGSQNLAVKLDNTIFRYGTGTVLRGTAPAAPTIRITGGCGENAPLIRPLSGSNWSYGFVPCRNGTVTVTAPTQTGTPPAAAIELAFWVAPHLTLHRLSAARYLLTAITNARLNGRAIVQVAATTGWHTVRTMPLPKPHSTGTDNIARLIFVLRTERGAKVRVLTTATASYLAGTSNTITTA